MMQAAMVALVAFVGACIGSFLNVVIYRLPIMMQREWQAEAKAVLGVKEQPEASPELFNLAVPRSACPECSAPIKAWQNIPVFSYLFLRGQCHNCHAPISIRYPVVESLAALLAVLLLFRFGLGPEMLALALFTAACMALVGIDIDHQLLPDSLTLPLLWAGLLINTQNLFASLPNAVWGAALGYGFLWAVFWVFKWVTGKEGMGYGDFKLMAAFGAWFGWSILPNTILLSSVMGAMVGLLLIWRKGQSMQTPIPYGPFIIVAGWLTALFPEYVVIFNYL